MSKNIIVVLMYHRHKLSYLNYIYPHQSTQFLSNVSLYTTQETGVRNRRTWENSISVCLKLDLDKYGLL
jgi:hypothetical protein